MIGRGDSVVHFADRYKDVPVRGLVQLTSERDGCLQALVNWPDEAEPRWSPVANLIKIPS